MEEMIVLPETSVEQKIYVDGKRACEVTIVRLTRRFKVPEAFVTTTSVEADPGKLDEKLEEIIHDYIYRGAEELLILVFPYMPESVVGPHTVLFIVSDIENKAIEVYSTHG